VTVSLDSPSCEVTLFDPVYRWFIGTLPDRPRDYTVWSTLEPSEVDSRTSTGIIQVGSATYPKVLFSHWLREQDLIWEVISGVFWRSYFLNHFLGNSSRKKRFSNLLNRFAHLNHQIFTVTYCMPRFFRSFIPNLGNLDSRLGACGTCVISDLFFKSVGR
jgi:hypothetical protein